MSLSLTAPPLKKVKLSDYNHVVDDLFKNKNKHTLQSNLISGKFRMSSTKLSKNLKRILIQFISRNETKTGQAIDIPIGFTPEKLQLLLNTLLNQTEHPLPYSFFYNHKIESNDSKSNENELKSNENEKESKPKTKQKDLNIEIQTSLRRFIENHNRFHFNTNSMHISTENILTIIYEPQAIFRIQAVSRCTANLPGHTEAILFISFRPDCKQIASASGDTTIRLWNPETQTPTHILKGHSHWVLTVQYSPNGSLLASADMTGELFIWNIRTGYKLSKYPLHAHSKFITSIAWMPFHLNAGKCEFICTSSKDKLIKIWNTRTRKMVFCLSGHTDIVTKVKWGGGSIDGSDHGLIYSSSRDRTIRIWSPADGTCVRVLKGHAHWVNHITISTESVLNSGAYDEYGCLTGDTVEEQVVFALKRYQACKDCRGELLCSASDDFTLFLWNPSVTHIPVARMTGHQQLVNHVSFSCDGRLIASASFDKSVRIWDGLTGRFIARLLGHVQSVYRVCWSSDNRMLASASQDSTVKIWNLANKKLVIDLPGHADEVYAVDWSRDGLYLCTGGKDRMLRIWQP